MIPSICIVLLERFRAKRNFRWNSINSTLSSIVYPEVGWLGERWICACLSDRIYYAIDAFNLF